MPPALYNGHLHTFCPAGNTCNFLPCALKWGDAHNGSTSGVPEAHLALAVVGLRAPWDNAIPTSWRGHVLRWGEGPLLTLVMTTKSAFCFSLMGRVCQLVLKPYLTHFKFYKSSKPKVYRSLHSLQCLHMLQKEANVRVADVDANMTLST